MSRVVGSASPMVRSVATAGAFASLYFLAVALTTSLIGDPGIAVLWPASGVYLGVMLVAPRHMWPSLACAAGVGSMAAYLHAGSSLEVSVAFAVPSSAEGLLAAVLVERIAGGRFRLVGLRDLVALVAGGAVIANALVALSAGAVAAQTFGVSFAESWLRWWSADALGIVAVAPLIVWAAGRWGPRAAALGGVGVALVATELASRASDLVARAGGVDGRIHIVQAFLAVLLLGSLAFAAAAGEGHRARTSAVRSRRRLRQVVDSSPDAYLAVDARDRITGWGASAEAMFGWTAPEALGRSLTEAIAPGAGPATPTPDGRELALVARDRVGRKFPVQLTVRPGSEGDDDHCHIFIRDLRESERQRGELSRANAELERRRLARDQVRQELERTTGELEGAGRRIEQQSAELAAAKQELQRLGRELALAAADRDAVLSELDDTVREQGRLEAELASSSEELTRAGAGTRALEQELERVRAAQAATAEELAREVTERRHAEQELEQARTRSAEERDELKRELEQARAESAEEHQHAERELEQARTRSAEERDGLERELEQARAESAEERQRAERELEQARAALAEERQGAERELEHVRAEFAEERQRAERELEQACARFTDERERLEQELEELAAELSGRERAERELEHIRAGFAGERDRAERELEQAHVRFAEERERLERSLQEASGSLARANGELRLLGDHSTEMVSRYDDRGICLYASAASRRLLGYEPEELVGRAGAGLLHPDDRHRLARARAARSESTFEARLLRKAGDFIWVEVSLRPVWGRGTDRLLGITTIVRDISDRRDLRERMRARDEVRRFTPEHTPPNQTAA